MSAQILKSEILEQPELIRQLRANEQSQVNDIGKRLSGQFRYVMIAARGTSDNAARFAQYLLGANNRLTVALATPSLFSLYQTPPDLTDALVIGISQSGQSPDIVSVLAAGRRQKRPTLAITNDPNSPLAEAADYVIPLHAGAEKAVAATKTYTCSLLALCMLACSLDNSREKTDSLRQVGDWMETMLNDTLSLLKEVQRYRYAQHVAVIGRGFNYATAFEIALKVKELTRIVSEPYSSADFRHGPIATIQPGFPVILVAPGGVVFQDVEELATRLHRSGADMVIISDNQKLLTSADIPMEIPPGIPEWLTPLVTVLPGQLFAMQLAIEKKLDADHPSGLSKVTETL